MMIRAAQIASHRRYIPVCTCTSAEPSWAVGALLDSQPFAKRLGLLSHRLVVRVSATSPCHIIPWLQRQQSQVMQWVTAKPHSRLQDTCFLVLASSPALSAVSLTILWVSGGNESLHWSMQQWRSAGSQGAFRPRSRHCRTGLSCKSCHMSIYVENILDAALHQTSRHSVHHVATCVTWMTATQYCLMHALLLSLDQIPSDTLHQFHAYMKLLSLIDWHRLQSQSMKAFTTASWGPSACWSPHYTVPHAVISVESLPQGQSGMWHACTKGHAEAVSELLSHGGRTNDADENVRLPAPMPCLNPLPQSPDSIPCLNPKLQTLNPLPQVPASNLCLNPPAWTPYLSPLPLLRADMHLFLVLEVCSFCWSGLTGALHSALDDHTTIIPRNHKDLCHVHLYHDHTLQNTHVSSRNRDHSALLSWDGIWSVLSLALPWSSLRWSTIIKPLRWQVAVASDSWC